MFKQLQLVCLLLCASFNASAYDLEGNYCWMNHEYRLIMPVSGPNQSDNFYPSLRDAIVEVERSLGGDKIKKVAANNCKTDILFLHHPKTDKVIAKILIKSEIACKWTE